MKIKILILTAIISFLPFAILTTGLAIEAKRGQSRATRIAELELAISELHKPHVRVEWFTGIRNDSEAVDRAITAAMWMDNGGTVFFSNRAYKVENRIVK